ncbi:MAG: hypothetical protein K2Y51_15395 [Gammaproteobacteria bacterium]|jgi:hypothetical protein|nr:hypothetical protein [Gammaproteobacteria bacterium]
MRACAMQPADRRAQLKRVGNDLVQHYGKRKFYSIQQVQNANKRQGVTFDFACWSHAFFNSHADFDRLHAQVGEACDYSAMKREMAESVSTPGDSAFFDFDLSWLELPDIDWSVFDFLDS